MSGIATPPRRGDAMRDDVGIDERHAVGGEQIGNRRLAAADAAREANSKHASAPEAGGKRRADEQRHRAAGARNGPKGSGSSKRMRPIHVAMSPTTAPVTAAIRTICGSAAQPSHAPSAASSLKSP